MTFDKCLYLRGRLRLTTARRLSAYMSSRALVMTTVSSFLCYVTFFALAINELSLVGLALDLVD